MATHRLAPLAARLSRADALGDARLESRDASLWKRRSSIICQVGLKEKTDRELLFACIEPNLPDGDFFIRKAIGWALRALAWVDPDEVVRYVSQNESRLSPLSRREALKNVPDS